MIAYLELEPYKALLDSSLTPEQIASGRKLRAIDPIKLESLGRERISASITSFSSHKVFLCSASISEEGKLVNPTCTCGKCQEDSLCPHLIATFLLAEEVEKRDFKLARTGGKKSLASLRYACREFSPSFGGVRYMALVELLGKSNQEILVNPNDRRTFFCQAAYQGYLEVGEDIRKEILTCLASLIGEQEEEESGIKEYFCRYVDIAGMERRDEFASILLKEPSTNKAISSMFADYYDHDESLSKKALSYCPNFSWRQMKEVERGSLLRFLSFYKGSEAEFTYLCRLLSSRIDCDFLQAVYSNPSFPLVALKGIQVEEGLKEEIDERLFWGKIESSRDFPSFLDNASSLLGKQEHKERLMEAASKRGYERLLSFLYQEGDPKELVNVEARDLVALLPYLDLERQEVFSSISSYMKKASVKEVSLLASIPYLEAFRPLLVERLKVEERFPERAKIAKKWGCLEELGYRRYVCIS